MNSIRRVKVAYVRIVVLEMHWTTWSSPYGTVVRILFPDSVWQGHPTDDEALQDFDLDILAQFRHYQPVDLNDCRDACSFATRAFFLPDPIGCCWDGCSVCVVVAAAVTVAAQDSTNRLLRHRRTTCIA